VARRAGTAVVPSLCKNVGRNKHSACKKHYKSQTRPHAAGKLGMSKKFHIGFWFLVCYFQKWLQRYE